MDDSDDKEQELRHPVVKFTIVFLSDNRPEDMIDRVHVENGNNWAGYQLGQTNWDHLLLSQPWFLYIDIIEDTLFLEEY